MIEISKINHKDRILVNEKWHYVDKDYQGKLAIKDPNSKYGYAYIRLEDLIYEIEDIEKYVPKISYQGATADIEAYIKDNGNLVQDKTFKCGFCQVSDWKHNEMYDIKDYDKKLFNSNEIYIISQDVFNKKIIAIINEYFKYVESTRYDEQGKFLDLIDILSDKLFFGESTDVLIKLAKYDFIRYKNFPFNENEKKDYTHNPKDNYTSQEIYWIKCWKQKENISWTEFKEHTKHKARYFDHEKSTFKLSQKLKPFRKLYKSLEKKFINISFDDAQNSIFITYEDNAKIYDENQIENFFNVTNSIKQENFDLGFYLVKIFVEKNFGLLMIKKTENGIKYIIRFDK